MKKLTHRAPPRGRGLSEEFGPPTLSDRTLKSAGLQQAPRAGRGPRGGGLIAFYLRLLFQKVIFGFCLQNWGRADGGGGDDKVPQSGGRPRGDVCQRSSRFGVENAPDSLSSLLLKVGSKLMEAPGSVASETWGFTAGKMQPGQPPGQMTPLPPRHGLLPSPSLAKELQPHSQGPRGGESYSNSEHIHARPLFLLKKRKRPLPAGDP